MFYSSSDIRNQNAELEKMITTIAEAVEPDKIFCKHDFLLVVLSNKCQNPIHDYKTVIEASILPSSFHYSLYYIQEIEKFLCQGHLFYSTFCSKENLVYDNGIPTLPLPLYQRIQNITLKSTHNFTTGFKRAQCFLEGAVFYLAKEELALAAFMLHQATEQALRTIILSVTGHEVRTHTISELKQHLKRCAPLLNSFLASSKEKILLDRLEKAYTCTRYTDKYEITLEELNLLLSHIRHLFTDTKNAFEEMISAFTGTDCDSLTCLNKAI